MPLSKCLLEETSAMSVEGYLEVVLFLMLLEREGET